MAESLKRPFWKSWVSLNDLVSTVMLIIGPLALATGRFGVPLSRTYLLLIYSHTSDLDCKNISLWESSFFHCYLKKLLNFVTNFKTGLTTPLTNNTLKIKCNYFCLNSQFSSRCLHFIWSLKIFKACSKSQDLVRKTELHLHDSCF